ncbi:hypothetical protein PV10_01020 [Exophiala mesophila]|uniref:Pentacotripeptide-repeat region of PRORP domain-containing protein n=1 Tax=Exophiala mesophila TaxID=212818 RepID=A0A0D2AEB3_EXOME|nr:uncharacterized protein PV10_01020 [Exophiala mesophila]KIV97248.1 hypothetical protein PV10_01020 [Exophiala mesophila]
MLERAASCAEPVSHLLVKRLELPLRSRRSLGPSFWKHGRNNSFQPPWWPHYLDSVRAEPQNISSVDRVDRTTSSSRPTSITTRSNLRTVSDSRNSKYHTQSSRRDRQSSSLNKQHNDTATVDSKGLADHGDTNPVQKDLQPSAQPPQSTFEGLPEAQESSTTEESPYRGEEDEEPIDAPRALQGILRYLSNTPEQVHDTSLLDKMVYLFRQLTDQGAFGSEVLSALASYGYREHADTALAAFRAIHRDQRTKQDYNNAVLISVHSNMYRSAQAINLEATDAGLNDTCSPLLLLYSVSRRLWRTAASVWQTSYHDQFLLSLKNPAADEKLLAAVSKDQNLPAAILRLEKLLSARSLMVSPDQGALMSLSRKLLRLLVSSGDLMSDITPKGLLEILDTFSPPPNVHGQALQTLLKLAKRPDKSGLSVLIYRHMRKLHPGVLPSRATLGILISLHCDEEATADVLQGLLAEFAEHHGMADKSSYQLVLSALSKQSDIDGVQNVFLDLCRVHGRPEEAAFYTPLLYAYARIGDVQGAERELKRMEEWNIKPTAYCWNILLYAYARSTHPEETLNRFAALTKQGFQPDVVSFGTLMALHSRNGDTDALLDLIELAQKSGIQGSYEIIAGLVQSYCLNDQIDTAVRLASVVTEAKFAGSPVKIWNHILRYYAFQAMPDKALEVQEKMKELGVVPDDMTYAALMSGLVVIGKTTDAAQILRILNLSSRLDATRFHYAIILHGYAMEGNRDMVQVIYKEMLHRFSRVGASANMTMLRFRAKLDLAEDGEDLTATLDQLMEIMTEDPQPDRASKTPQPGLHRQRPIDAVPSAYFELVAHLLTTKGRYRQANRLMQRDLSLKRSSYPSLQGERSVSLDFLTISMKILCSQQKWTAVEEAWNEILTVAIPFAQHVPVASRLQGVTTSHGQLQVEDSAEMPMPSSKEIRALNDRDTEFASMIAESPSNSPLARPDLQILPSQRFLIAGAITQYISALRQQTLFDEAIAVVRRLEEVGFALTSKNLNFYIQTLTQSPDLNHQILAFSLFENRLLPNTPPWTHLRRGKWLSPSSFSDGDQEASSLHIVSRRFEEQRRPGQLMPTYWTTVYLATVLRRFRRLARRDDANKSLLYELLEKAKGTFAYISQLPYHRDRIQALLLRKKQFIIGDIPKRTRQATPANRSGVLESQSPVDHVPVDNLATVEEDIQSTTDNSHDDQGQGQGPRSSIDQMEIYEGQIPRGVTFQERQGQFETLETAQYRVSRKERRLLETLRIMRHDITLPRIMSSRRFGRPSALPTVKPGQPTPQRLAGQSLFNPRFTRLESRDREIQRQRQQRLAMLDDMSNRSHPPPLEFRKSRVSVRDTTQDDVLADWSDSESQPARAWSRRLLRYAKSSDSPLEVKLTAQIPRIPRTNRMKRSFTRNRLRREGKLVDDDLKEESSNAQDDNDEATHEAEETEDSNDVE